jgi:hypothetical protein
MRKNAITEGTVYAAQEGKYGSIKKVLVVKNEEFHLARRRSYGNRIPRDDLYSDAAYVKAHLAWALTQAFAQDTTPKEAQAAKNALSEATSQAEDRWYKADPMRMFVPGRGVSGGRSWYGDTSGILCRVAQTSYKDGAQVYGEPDGPLTLIERRHIFATWDDHVAQEAAALKARKEAARREAERKDLLARQRAVIKPAIEAAFADSDVSAPYISDYDREVKLSYTQVMVLLGVSVEEVDAA